MNSKVYAREPLGLAGNMVILESHAECITTPSMYCTYHEKNIYVCLMSELQATGAQN